MTEPGRDEWFELELSSPAIQGVGAILELGQPHLFEPKIVQSAIENLIQRGLIVVGANGQQQVSQLLAAFVVVILMPDGKITLGKAKPSLQMIKKSGSTLLSIPLEEDWLRLVSFASEAALREYWKERSLPRAALEKAVQFYLNGFQT